MSSKEQMPRATRLGSRPRGPSRWISGGAYQDCFYTLTKGWFVRKKRFCGRVHGRRFGIHASIITKMGTLREDIVPVQNLEYLGNWFIDGWNISYIPIRQGGFLAKRSTWSRTQTSGSWELSLGYNILMPVGIKYVKGEIPISISLGARRILKSLDLRIHDSRLHLRFKNDSLG